MKNRYLFGTLAVSALFASCSNELETVVENVEQEIALEEVVGATLVSKGGSINLNGMESRATNGAFLKGDKLALAWYNVESSVSDEQTLEGWLAAMNSYASITEANKRIFANHKFTAQDGGQTFVTESNVYQGAHFVYFPYQYEPKIAKKVVDVNSLAFDAKPADDKNSTSDASYDMANKAFYLSAQDFLMAGENGNINEETGVLEAEFVLQPVVNALRINATPMFEETSDDLKKLKITKIQVKSGQEVFANALEINPAQIPAVIRDQNGNILVADTRSAIEDYAAEATKTYTKSLDREIAAAYDLSEVRNMNIFTLPTSTSYTGNEGNALSIKVFVESENGIQGEFDIKRNSRNTEENKETIKTLEERLGTTADYTLTKIVKTVAGQWTHNNLKVELTEDNVNFTWDIDGKPQWDDAVALAEEIGKDVEFNLVGDVDFTETINFPSTCKVTVIGEGAMNFKGAEMVWPAGANVDLTNASVKIASGTTLTINGAKGARNELDANVTNEGTIVLNEYGTVKTVDNLKGRIEVKYGSYVITGENKGIVAYVLTGKDKAREINNLININTVEGIASVNTLVVNSKKTLDLDLTDPAEAGVYDPYTGTTGNVDEVELEDLSNINVEMNGGSIVGGAKTAVGNISVLKGTNTIKDVIPAGITIEAGATLNIDASVNTSTGIKNELNMEAIDITVKGILNVEAKTHINNLKNTGKVDATGYLLHCVGICDNTGTSIGDVKVCDCGPEVQPTDYEGLETAVYNAFNNWKEITQLDPFDAVAVVNQVNANNNSEAVVNFYNALKAWYDAKVADGILNVNLPERGSVEELHITLYNSMAEAEKKLEF